MKFLTKIQSVSDIITNSSSETFLMSKSPAEYYNSLDADGCISIDKVTEEWIRNNYWEADLICGYLDIEESYDRLSYEDWNAFVDLYILPLMDRLEGLYVVDIEDHFSGCEDVLEDARGDCLWQESRH